MHRARKEWVWLVVVGLSFASAQPAWAADEKKAKGGDPSDEERVRPKGQVGIDLGTYFRSDDEASQFELAPIISGWFSVAEGVDIKLDWGVAFVNMAPDQGSSTGAFYLGNPALTVRRVIHADRNEIYFGIGMTAPVSSIPVRPQELDTDASMNVWDNKYLKIQHASRIAAAMRGLWDYWLWMPEHLSIVVPLGARMVSEEHILLGGQAAWAVLIPTGDYESGRGELVLQVDGEVGFGFEYLDWGVFLRGVVLPVPEGDEGHAQFSAGPFVRLNFKGGYFNATGLFNLDSPYGAFAHGAKVWGIMLAGGANF